MTIRLYGRTHIAKPSEISASKRIVTLFHNSRGLARKDYEPSVSNLLVAVFVPSVMYMPNNC